MKDLILRMCCLRKLIFLSVICVIKGINNAAIILENDVDSSNKSSSFEQLEDKSFPNNLNKVYGKIEAQDAGCNAGFSCETNCNTANAVCIPCLQGYYQPNAITSATKCVPCKLGYTSAAGAASCHQIEPISGVQDCTSNCWLLNNNETIAVTKGQLLARIKLPQTSFWISFNISMRPISSTTILYSIFDIVSAANNASVVGFLMQGSSHQSQVAYGGSSTVILAYAAPIPTNGLMCHMQIGITLGVKAEVDSWCPGSYKKTVPINATSIVNSGTYNFYVSSPFIANSAAGNLTNIRIRGE